MWFADHSFHRHASHIWEISSASQQHVTLLLNAAYGSRMQLSKYLMKDSLYGYSKVTLSIVPTCRWVEVLLDDSAQTGTPGGPYLV